MQNLESNKENTNPDHFLNNSSVNTAINPEISYNSNAPTNDNTELNTNLEDTTLSTRGATRPKFSFASDYTPSRHYTGLTTSSYDYTANLPISSSSSFAVLNNDYSSLSSTFPQNKPNAIVHPIRRAEQAALPTNDNDHGQELRVTGYNPLLSVTYPQPGNSNTRQFAEELNRKLSHLSSNRDLRNSSQHVCRKKTIQEMVFVCK